LNLSANASLYFGSFLKWLIGIHKNDYNIIWEPVVIQNEYLLIMIITISFIDFPDPSKVPVDSDEQPSSEFANANRSIMEDDITEPDQNENKEDPRILVD
jgi:hypothetical protein